MSSPLQPGEIFRMDESVSDRCRFCNKRVIWSDVHRTWVGATSLRTRCPKSLDHLMRHDPELMTFVDAGMVDMDEYTR